MLGLSQSCPVSVARQRIRIRERERFALARYSLFLYPGTLVTRPRFIRIGTQHLKPWPTRYAKPGGSEAGSVRHPDPSRRLICGINNKPCARLVPICSLLQLGNRSEFQLAVSLSENVFISL